MRKVETYASVRDAIADTPEQAAYCGVTQPRMNGLLRGQVSRNSMTSTARVLVLKTFAIFLRLQRP